jgi:hypothetical protein
MGIYRALNRNVLVLRSGQLVYSPLLRFIFSHFTCLYILICYAHRILRACIFSLCSRLYILVCFVLEYSRMLRAWIFLMLRACIFSYVLSLYILSLCVLVYSRMLHSCIFLYVVWSVLSDLIPLKILSVSSTAIIITLYLHRIWALFVKVRY